MYCPQCATPLDRSIAHCPACQLDVRPIARMLAQAPERSPRLNGRQSGGMPQLWQQQRHALGLLLVLCSLLVGCLIPLSIGLLNGFTGLSSVVTVLAGLAGVLLVLGIMLLLAAEGAILVSRPAGGQQAIASASPAHLLEERLAVSEPAQDSPSARSANR